MPPQGSPINPENLLIKMLVERRISARECTVTCKYHVSFYSNLRLNFLKNKGSS